MNRICCGLVLACLLLTVHAQDDQEKGTDGKKDETTTIATTVVANATTVARTVPRYVNKTFAFPPDQPVVKLDCKVAFDKLTDKERLYAHHLSRASYYGGLIVLAQLSQESPQIFRLIHRINLAQSPQELRDSFKDSHPELDKEDFDAFFIYCSGIYANMGNYNSFGDFKFVPDLPFEKFEAIVKGSKAWKDDQSGMSELWDSVKKSIFSLGDLEKQLGLADKGVTKYWSANCNKDDAEKVSRYFKKNGIEGWISRVIKTVNETDGKPIYEIRHAAVLESVLAPFEEFEDSYFNVTTGDFGPLLNLVNEELAKAKKYVANEKETGMLDLYIDSFERGSLDAHKNGSRFWIENKSPNVETYIGFIEVYRDPIGQRGEFEGFVSMVNKDQSVKFQQLVENAEKFLPQLPWPRTFEKDRFLRPDFTSLDVLTFAGSGIPKGINIPNYDEIRQDEGFKNVNLGNVVSSTEKSTKKANFVDQEDHELLEKWRSKSFDVQVGLHELLGHGSGKLFTVDENGEPNFNVSETINPLTNKSVDPSTVYQSGETYGSRFSSMSSAYEECRAETVGLFLSVNEDVIKIFGLEKDKDDVIFVNWMSLCLSALGSTELYSPTAQEWQQAHSQARFVILNVLLEAGEDFITINETVGADGKPDIHFKMDRNKLLTVGLPAIGKFLTKLQVYKATGDIESARKMFEGYSAVNDDNPKLPWLKFRSIAIERRRPRKMFVQANTVENGTTVDLLEYEPTHDGMMKSWTDRFPAEDFKVIDNALKVLYERDLPYFVETNAA